MKRILLFAGVGLLILLLAVRGSPALAASHGGHAGAAASVGHPGGASHVGHASSFHAAHPSGGSSAHHATPSHSFALPHASAHYAVPHAAAFAHTPAASHFAVHQPAGGGLKAGGRAYVPHVASAPHATTSPHVATGAASRLRAGPNLATQRGLASVASDYRRDQHGDGDRHFDRNRGWNGYYYHHPWSYLPYAYSIYPYTYGLALGSGYYDYGGGYGYGGGYYNYGGVPVDNGYNNYGYNNYVYNDYPPAAYGDNYPPPSQYAPEAAPSPSTAQSAPQFSTQALAAFSAGNYEEAVRLADHALVDAPKDARTHELLSLAMFALGDYRGAAIEAHAAISLGPIGTWANLQAYYASPDRYTTQLRALENYVVSHPTAADAHFLLGYQYLMLGHSDAAKYQFQTAHQLTPDDALAAKLGS